MQRTALILAYCFICVNCFSQQYPFVHYTPKDGLISNQIRSIYQDSKGRLYFTSMNGLSVYDGSRFINYASKNGLANDIVNCVMEMGDDSVWIITNIGNIHYLVNGKLKPLALNESPPIIDNLVRDEKGILYAASEQGLYRFHDNKFVQLNLFDIKGGNIDKFISNVIPVGKYLLVVRDNQLVNTDEKYILYLYDKEAERIVAQTQKELVFNLAKAPDGRIWTSTDKGFFALDTIELKKGKIFFQELAPIYAKIKKSGFIFFSFDRIGNCWMTDRVSVLKKVSADGSVISFTTASGLSTHDINHVFQDREGTTWIATYSAGVDKLVHSSFSFTPNPFGLAAVNHISYAAHKDQLLLYSINNAKAVVKINDNYTRDFEIKNASLIGQIIESPKGIYGISEHAIYKMIASGSILFPEAMFTDTIDNQMGAPLVDKNGNLLLCGKHYLTALVDGKTISRQKINYFTNQAVSDTSGNIWIVTRAGELIQFETNPGRPDIYLEEKLSFTKELSGINPRSFIIDRNNLFLIGSRSFGLYAFRLTDGHLIQKFHLTSATGLSDNFISHLAVDLDNNIWACSPLGLDKISIKNGVPIIENITKQNNIYQSVNKVVIDKSNTAWALLSNGLIKITSENRKPTDYSPTLMMGMVKAGKDTIKNEASTILSYKQNNLSFYFAATSFLDEKQVLYSYQLLGGSNDQWSESSNNASVSFIDLHPGDYILKVKAKFPAGSYPEQIIQYKFSITPPWWQTWWFRSIAGLLIVGLLIISIRFYYRRKLEKQKTVLEKQQAIEKERTRIATDMHDDLGAGLSRIKFLSQLLSNKQVNDESVKTGLEKITGYSDEMTEKMGEIVWALNEKNDTLADLVAYTRSYALEYLANHNILCKVNTPMQLPGTFITGEIRRNIFLAVKECLHNIIKHAGATTVSFSIQLNGAIEIVIHDNGKGINWNEQRQFSNGLQNIKKRLKEINGKAEFFTEQGTKVVLQAPLSL